VYSHPATPHTQPPLPANRSCPANHLDPQQRQCLLARPPPRLGLGPAACLQDVFPVRARDDPPPAVATSPTDQPARCRRAKDSSTVGKSLIVCPAPPWCARLGAATRAASTRPPEASAQSASRLPSPPAFARARPPALTRGSPPWAAGCRAAGAPRLSSASSPRCGACLDGLRPQQRRRAPVGVCPAWRRRSSRGGWGRQTSPVPSSAPQPPTAPRRSRGEAGACPR
jgi:hypothetical protein